MSITSIAKKAGVSPATVSRILNNPDYHSQIPGIREKVWKIAMSENYTPNEAARNLKLGSKKQSEKTYFVNILLTRSGANQVDPFFEELFRVIESQVHNNTCILSKVWHQPIFSNDKKCKNINIERYVSDMYAEVQDKCDGLIIIGKCNKDVIKQLNKSFKNVVSVNRNSTNYEIDEVVCDGNKIASIAVDYLVELGHKSIGYVGACHNESRYRGYLDSLTKHDIDIDPDFIYETKQTEAEGYECMEKILQAEEHPTGIYCANDITAIGMLKCLEKHKSRYFTPAIIASDDIEQAQYSNPMLTTIRLPKEEMGKFAFSLLLDRMKGGHQSVVKLEMEAKLVVRNSCMRRDMTEWIEYYI